MRFDRDKETPSLGGVAENQMERMTEENIVTPREFNVHLIRAEVNGAINV